MEPGKLVIAISLLGIGILYGISIMVNPPYVSLGSIADHNNELVKTKGLVTALRRSSGGNTILEITADGTELPVFVHSTAADNLDLRYGDEIELEGRVQQYGGNYVITTTGDSIRPINSRSSIYFVTEVAEHPDAYKGRRIRVLGTVSRVYRNVFYLDQMRVVAAAETEHIPRIEKGDRVIADGVFVYNKGDLRYELKLIALSYPQTIQYS